MSSVGGDVEHPELYTLLMPENTATTPWKTTWQNDLDLDNATSAFPPA